MTESSAGAEELPLSASHVLHYDYRRSLGPTLSQFFTGLRDRRILAAKTHDGRVILPPAEYDPATGEATEEQLIEVGPGGVVTSWAWVGEPRASHPHDHPFAFALVQLDGADTAMLHTVEVDDESAMQTGMRVVPRWADETIGRIQDISSFVPEGAA
jgi:uncharacterized OB-fold protein